MITKKAVFYSLGLIAAGSIAAAAYAEVQTKITTPGCSIDGTSHKCNANTGKDSQNLDPRAESFSDLGIDPDNRSDDFDIRATYDIVDATRTTVFQMLNNDSSKSDTNKPVLFLTATKRSDGTYFLCNGNSKTTSGCAGISFSGVPRNFTLRLHRPRNSTTTNATLTLSYVKDGRSQSQSSAVSMTTTPDGTSRGGGRTFPRWGVYMHDLNSRGLTTRTVEVKVSGVSLGSVG